MPDKHKFYDKDIRNVTYAYGQNNEKLIVEFHFGPEIVDINDGGSIFLDKKDVMALAKQFKILGNLIMEVLNEET